MDPRGAARFAVYSPLEGDGIGEKAAEMIAADHGVRLAEFVSERV